MIVHGRESWQGTVRTARLGSRSIREGDVLTMGVMNEQYVRCCMGGKISMSLIGLQREREA